MIAVKPLTTVIEEIVLARQVRSQGEMRVGNSIRGEVMGWTARWMETWREVQAGACWEGPGETFLALMVVHATQDKMWVFVQQLSVI